MSKLLQNFKNCQKNTCCSKTLKNEKISLAFYFGIEMNVEFGILIRRILSNIGLLLDGFCIKQQHCTGDLSLSGLTLTVTIILTILPEDLMQTTHTTVTYPSARNNAQMENARVMINSRIKEFQETQKNVKIKQGKSQRRLSIIGRF